MIVWMAILRQQAENKSKVFDSKKRLAQVCTFQGPIIYYYIEGMEHFLEGIEHFLEGIKHFLEGIEHFRKGIEHFLKGITPLRHRYINPNEKSNKYKYSLPS